ncbi:hypothetical protein BGX27_005356 [Mortierella sp. AM989]|nr:hypothetical protein BGX27_005356 [Mortierella sp. AM989]
MRFITIASAAVGLAIFSASTQALPAPVAPVLENAKFVDAVVERIVTANVGVFAKARVELEAAVSADVYVKVEANANILDIVKTGVSAEALATLKVDAKAEADLEVQAIVEANVDQYVIANIDPHVRAVLGLVCSVVNQACLDEKFQKIADDVVALIKVDINSLMLKIKADANVKVQARVDAYIENVAVELNVAKVDIKAVVSISADIHAHVHAFVAAIVDILVKVNSAAIKQAL